MSEIKAVLLIPEEGDPHKLLKKGPYGARPPWAARCATCQRWVGGDGEGLTCHCFRGPAIPSALVLAWGGKPVAEGCWGANRAEWGEFCSAVDYIMHGTPEEAEEFRYYVLARTAGDLVLLDAEGREVSDE